MSQTYDDIDQSTDTQTEVNTTLDDRTDTLRSNFEGSSAPGSPVVGQLWIDTSATPNLLKQYGDIGAGNAWNVIGPVARLNADINLDPSSGDTRATCNQIKGARIENRGAHVAAAAGNVGYIYLLTGDGEVYLLENTVAGARKALLSVVPGTTYDSVDIDLAGTNTNDGTNPPTLATKGTSPTVKGWLFDAAAEKRVLVAKVPANWEGATDLRVRLTCVLNQAETNGDDIDWSANWVSVTPGTDAVSKTSTAAVDVDHDIGTGSADGTEHDVDIVIDHDHADNPVAAGDTLYIEINRTDLANVGGVILTAARLLFPQKARHSRA